MLYQILAFLYSIRVPVVDLPLNICSFYDEQDTRFGMTQRPKSPTPYIGNCLGGGIGNCLISYCNRRRTGFPVLFMFVPKTGISKIDGQRVRNFTIDIHIISEYNVKAPGDNRVERTRPPNHADGLKREEQRDESEGNNSGDEGGSVHDFCYVSGEEEKNGMPTTTSPYKVKTLI